MRPSRRAKFRYLLSSLPVTALEKIEHSVIARKIPLRRRFFVSLSWFTAAGTLLMLAVIRPYEPSDILLAIAGGYAMAFNVFVARRYLYRSLA